MKKSRIFIGISLLILSIVTAFATKANRHFSSPATVYYAMGGSFVPIFSYCGATSIMTTWSTPRPLKFGSTMNLYTLYYNPGFIYIQVGTWNF